MKVGEKGLCVSINVCFDSGGLSLFLFFFGLYGALVFTRLTVMPDGKDLDAEYQDAAFQRFYWQQMRAPWMFAGLWALALFVQVVWP